MNSITIPASVTTIGLNVFGSCPKLSSINVASANSNYSSVDGVLFNKDKTTLIAYPAGNIATSYTIPSTVKNINDFAFIYCSKLTSISVPTSVTSIGNGTFWHCTGLTSITLPTHLSSIDTNAFEGCTDLKTINIPYKVLSLANRVFYDCTGLTAIHAKSATPINLSSITDIFTNVPVNSCTLYIPTGSKSLYQAADKWSTFTNMVEELPDCILSTNTVSLSGDGETKPVDMATSITWSAKSNQDWVTVSPSSGTEDATFSISAGTNPTIQSRTATVTIYYGETALQSITVTQNPGPPTLSVSSNSMTLNKKVSTVLINSNTTWTAASDQSWLTLNTASGEGNATLTLTADANLSPSTRSATITVAVSPSLTKTITVTQEAATLSLPSNTLTIKAGNGSTETVNVTSNVTWTAASDQSWLKLNTADGDGNATLTLTADANLSPSTRSATITVAVSPSLTKTITVTQEAATLSLPNTLSIKAGNSSTASANVTSNVTWTVISDQSWLTLNTAAGEGNATLTLTADANLSPSTRTATITVAVSPSLTKTITVTQEAATLSLPSNTLSIKGGNGSTASANVTSNVTWTVISDQSWLTLNTASGDGNATITLTADVNLSATPRTATITVAVSPSLTKTISVTQQPYIIASIIKKWNNILICDNSLKKFATYQWYKNGDIISNATKQYYRESESLSAGNYYVKVTTSDGTDGISNTLTTNGASKVITLSPNLVSTNQSVHLSINTLAADLKGGKLTIANLSGQLIQQSNTLMQDMTISGLAKGNYVIKITLSDGSSYNEKLIIY